MKTDTEKTTHGSPLPTPGKHPSLTTANVNAWFTAALADPARKTRMKQDWVALLLSEIDATPEQQESLRALPAADAKELQAVIAQVVEHGGTIHLDRPSETGPGRLVVQPAMAVGPVADAAVAGGGAAGFTIGIFHCTFDGFFRHWHCGWGPGKHTLTEP